MDENNPTVVARAKNLSEQFGACVETVHRRGRFISKVNCRITTERGEIGILMSSAESVAESLANLEALWGEANSDDSMIVHKQDEPEMVEAPAPLNALNSPAFVSKEGIEIEGMDPILFDDPVNDVDEDEDEGDDDDDEM